MLMYSMCLSDRPTLSHIRAVFAIYCLYGKDHVIVKRTWFKVAKIWSKEGLKILQFDYCIIVSNCIIRIICILRLTILSF